MSSFDKKWKCEKCQTILENQFVCFPGYSSIRNKLLQMLLPLKSLNSGEQKNIDTSKYEVKPLPLPLNSLNTDLIKEVPISNAHHEKSSNSRT